MEQQSAVYLDALGANVALSPTMKQELDTLGYTVVHNVADAEWLAAMRALIDAIVEREGDSLAMEHHQEATATRIANLINKGAIWEKVWSHPLILSACRHVFQGDFKVSSLNAREALFNAHAWHGGTRNRVGSRRRVLHGLYIDRADTAQQDQQRWLTPETASRLTPAQKWLLDVE